MCVWQQVPSFCATILTQKSCAWWQGNFFPAASETFCFASLLRFPFPFSLSAFGTNRPMWVEMCTRRGELSLKVPNNVVISERLCDLVPWKLQYKTDIVTSQGPSLIVKISVFYVLYHDGWTKTNAVLLLRLGFGNVCVWTAVVLRWLFGRMLLDSLAFVPFRCFPKFWLSSQL